MGFFDNITGFFTGQTAQDAADAQTAGLRQGYTQASGLLGQGRNALTDTSAAGRNALTTNYTAALQPWMTNYETAGKGVTGLTNALGLNGAEGNAAAVAAFWNNPAIQSQLDLGNENVLRNASRTGSLASGGVNADLQKFGQQTASQGWNQYIQNLMPFLNQSNTAAAGIGGTYGALGQGLANNYGALGGALNQSYGTQGNAAYGTEAGVGNAQASADLARNSGVANLFGLGMNLASLGAGGAGAGLGNAARSAGSSLFGNFTNFLSPGSGSFNRGYAEGGRPPVGVPAIVGERGPEMFVPDQPGTVVPNGMAARFAEFMPDQPGMAERLRMLQQQRQNRNSAPNNIINPGLPPDVNTYQPDEIMQQRTAPRMDYARLLQGFV